MDDNSSSEPRMPIFRLRMSPSEISCLPLSEQVYFRAYSEWLGTRDHFYRDNKPVDSKWFADGEKLLSALPWKHELLSYVLSVMFADGSKNLALDLSHEDAIRLIEQVILPCCTRAILHPFTMPYPEQESSFIISAFFCLSDALRKHFILTHRPSDLDTALTYYRRLLRIRIPKQIRLRRSQLS
ncbi:hypothetical protein BC834DRAFT_893618, partial [Gloeopeniophorella convolvens]